MHHRKILVLLGIIILVSAAALGWAVTRGHTFAGVLIGPAYGAPDFTLVDETGQTFSLSDLHGQWILLAYGYTSCPDVCPLTLGNLKQVKAALGTLADRVRVVFVSVDPERDTPSVMSNYVHHFGSDFKGLTGTPQQIALAAQAYSVKYEKKQSDSAIGYTVSHSAFIYLIDPQFRWRVTYPFGVAPQGIADDLTYLISHDKD